ncbi:MAG: YbaK/EbsC family protein [Gammaproteobacteria bacterium]|nr:YbaK/EbsC family protein [Gammaproteobacteria bacterium]
MTISVRLKDFLEQRSVRYEIVSHTRTQSSIDSSISAHITNESLAKVVIVKEVDTYLMVVVPSNRHLHLGRLHRHLGNEVGLATEEEVIRLFPDCDEGAVPPMASRRWSIAR